MAVSFKERIGYGVDWAVIIDESIEAWDYERLENASRMRPVLALKAIDKNACVKKAVLAGDEVMLKFFIGLQEYVQDFKKELMYSTFYDQVLYEVGSEGISAPLNTVKILLEQCEKDRSVYFDIGTKLEKLSFEIWEMMLGQFEIDKWFLNEGFERAAELGLADKMRLFYDKGAEIDAEDSLARKSPLVYAACNLTEDDDASLACVKLLLEWGADPNRPCVFKDQNDRVDVEHRLPLEMAVQRDNIDIVIELILAGADINEKLIRSAHENKYTEIAAILEKAEQGIMPTRLQGDFWRQLLKKQVESLVLQNRDDQSFSLFGSI